MICRYLYGEDVDATCTPLIAEFDNWWKLVKDGCFMREPELRQTTKRWIAQYLSVDGEAGDWVRKPKGAILNANLTINAMFLLLIVRHYLSPTGADNIVT